MVEREGMFKRWTWEGVELEGTDGWKSEEEKVSERMMRHSKSLQDGLAGYLPLGINENEPRLEDLKRHTHK